ncbi:MAG: extracellular solute-binding protein [Butyrivibrio sp.]|nr:extracellular solute-binding protein [Butyrivibrio sp.]
MKKWKRALGMAMAAVMLLGLCACGDGKNNNSQNNSYVNSELAKQYVYRMEEFDLDKVMAGDDEFYLEDAMLVDDRVYLVMEKYGETATGGGYEYSLVSVDKDFEDMQICELQQSMDEEREVASADKAGQPSGESDTAGDNGVMMLRTAVAVPVPVPAEEAVAEESSSEDEAESEGEEAGVEPEEISNIYEDTSFYNFKVTGGGRIYASKNHYFEDYSDPDNYVSRNDRSLCCWDMNGKMLWETPLDILSQEDKWYGLSTIVALENGNVMLLINGDESGKITVDKDGNLSEMRPVNDKLAEYMSNSNSFTAMSKDQILITYYGQDYSKIYAVTYDIKSDSVTESFPLPQTMAYNMSDNTSVDANGDIVFCSNQGIYKYHIGDDEPKQMMSFVNSDLTISSMRKVLPIDDEHFVGIYTEYDEETYRSITRGGVFTKVAPEDIPDKQVMVLGGNYISSDMRKRVVEYNKSSETHRIVLKDYSIYNTYDDYKAAYTQMNNDIISGSMPDILIVDSYGMSIENYVSKGLLANIDELIAKDPELSKTEFLDNVFEAARINGKLYEILPSFYVMTYVGKTSLVGERTQWTMEEARQVLADMPEGAQLFGEMTRAGFFSQVMQMCGSDFIDVSTGKCNFDSEEFISLMQYAKELPEELDYDGMWGEDYDSWYMNYQSQYRENRTLLSNCYMSRLQDMVQTINGSFGEDVSYVGFPNSSGQGSVISYNDAYALAAGSANLDAAWEFMRYYLTEEYQASDNMEWQLSVNKAQFDKMAEKATKKPTYEDENGKEQEYDYTYYINNESITIDPLTTQQLDKLKSFVTSVTKRAYYNEDVQNIINEEMDAFYKNQKSAKDVAGIIQSRAQIFVNENR